MSVSNKNSGIHARVYRLAYRVCPSCIFADWPTHAQISSHTVRIKVGIQASSAACVYIGTNLYDPSVILLLSTLYRFIGRCIIGCPVSARVQQFTKVAQAGGSGGTPVSTASVLHTYIRISLSPYCQHHKLSNRGILQQNYRLLTGLPTSNL